MYQSFMFLPAGRQIPFFSFLEKNVIVAIQNLAEIGGALKGSLGRAVPPWPSNPGGDSAQERGRDAHRLAQGCKFRHGLFQGSKKSWVVGPHPDVSTSSPVRTPCGRGWMSKKTEKLKQCVFFSNFSNNTRLARPTLFSFTGLQMENVAIKIVFR